MALYWTELAKPLYKAADSPARPRLRHIMRLKELVTKLEVARDSAAGSATKDQLWALVFGEEKTKGLWENIKRFEEKETKRRDKASGGKAK